MWHTWNQRAQCSNGKGTLTLFNASVLVHVPSGESIFIMRWDVERDTTFITLNKITVNIASIINSDSTTWKYKQLTPAEYNIIWDITCDKFFIASVFINVYLVFFQHHRCMHYWLNQHHITCCATLNSSEHNILKRLGY